MHLSQAHGNIVNIHNMPLMSMLNGCQNDLATWQNWIVFDKPRLEPEQGSKQEESHWKKRDTDPRGVFWRPLWWTNEKMGAYPLELGPGSNREVSRKADPCGGPGGESHCHWPLMGTKILQLTKTCERLRSERHLWFKSGSYTMRSAVKKASKREDTISHTHKDKPTWSPILVTISHFHIFTSQNWGLACFTLLLKQKQLLLREGLLKSFSWKAKGKVIVRKGIYMILCLSCKEITS